MQVIEELMIFSKSNHFHLALVSATQTAAAFSVSIFIHIYMSLVSSIMRRKATIFFCALFRHFFLLLEPYKSKQ